MEKFSKKNLLSVSLCSLSFMLANFSAYGMNDQFSEDNDRSSYDSYQPHGNYESFTSLGEDSFEEFSSFEIRKAKQKAPPPMTIKDISDAMVNYITNGLSYLGIIQGKNPEIIERVSYNFPKPDPHNPELILDEQK